MKCEVFHLQIECLIIMASSSTCKIVTSRFVLASLRQEIANLLFSSEDSLGRFREEEPPYVVFMNVK
jgi:hypothetical protein